MKLRTTTATARFPDASYPGRKTARRLTSGVALLILALTTSAAAQDRRAIIFGDAGAASIGHADSEQGRAPIFGGGVGWFLTPRLVVEADVHRGHVANVFGRAQHDFSQTTFTGSLVFRTPARGPGHFVAGGGVAIQRAQIEYDEPPLAPVDAIETIRLMHGKVGADWDLSDRLVLRTHGVIWMGGGLDWVLGARVGLGYRF